ncbi:MAG: hypothetical protein ACI9IP_001156 [Arcticibacterium sp.]
MINRVLFLVKQKLLLEGKWSLLGTLIVFFVATGKLRGQGNFEILISEVFADPTPSHGLPEKEFIELYNNSGHSINLKGYTLFYNTTNVDFPDFDFAANTYLIVCRVNNVSFLETYGQIVGLSKFSLLNGGTKLRIENSNQDLVFEVTYSPDWYATERDQGYSLELIDLNTPCKEVGNWTSSLSDIGGTPGATNASAATVSDMEGPSLVNYEELAPDLFSFSFSEKLGSEVSILSVSSDLVIESVSFSKDNNYSVVVKFSDPLQQSGLIDVYFNAMADCSGNLSPIITATIGNIDAPEVGELLISEVLFNPISGGEDFVEIYNNSEKLLNLRGLAFSRTNTAGELENPKVVFASSQTIEPKGVLCLSENARVQIEIYPKAHQGNIIEIDHLPAYSNAEGEVILMLGEEMVLERFSYTEDMHHPSIDDTDGISLERISFEIGANEASNWQSASFNDNYATPGYINPENTFTDAFIVSVSPAVFTPDNDGFDEETLISFSADKPGNLTSKIYDVNGRFIKEISNNQYLSNILEYKWRGLDNSGASLPMGYYILFSEYRVDGKILQNSTKILLARAK